MGDNYENVGYKSFGVGAGQIFINLQSDACVGDR